MALQDEFARSGQWLFRRRSFLPLLLTPLVAFQMRDFTFPDGSHVQDTVWDLFCLAIALAGIAVRILTVGHTPVGTSGRNTRTLAARTLNTTGMYSIVRHPLYLGNCLIWMGIALFPRSGGLALTVALAFWLYYERIMFAEEIFLREKFGSAFDRWAAQTPAFLPDPRRWQPSPLPFSLRSVLRREYSGVFAVIVSMSLLDLIGERMVLHKWRMETFWMVLLLAAALLYLTVRTLKRKTRILDVAGR